LIGYSTQRSTLNLAKDVGCPADPLFVKLHDPLTMTSFVRGIVHVEYSSQWFCKYKAGLHTKGNILVDDEGMRKLFNTEQEAIDYLEKNGGYFLAADKKAGNTMYKNVQKEERSFMPIYPDKL